MKNEKLKHIIYNAIKNVPFYMKKYEEKQGIDYDKAFSQMPILDKSYYLHRLPELTSLSCSKDSLREEFTSGSTGIPLKCYKSLNDKMRIQSSIYRYRKKFNSHLRVTDRYLRLYGSWREFNVENNALLFSVFYLEKLVDYIDIIIRFQPKWILGTPSAVIDFIDKLQQIGKLDFFRNSVPLLFIEVTGELLSEFQKRYIENKFSVLVVNHYGCREIWHIAFSCECGCLHVAQDNVYVDIVDESGKNVVEQEGEIVITSLNCYDIPFIRYRLGDIGKISMRQCKCGNNSPILQLTGGRTSEYIMLADGSRISSVLIHHVFRKVLSRCEVGIDSYYVKQVTIQEIEFYLQTNKNYKYDVENYICELLKEIIGDINIKFIYNMYVKRGKNGKMNFFKGLNSIDCENR